MILNLIIQYISTVQKPKLKRIPLMTKLKSFKTECTSDSSFSILIYKKKNYGWKLTFQS